MAVVGIVFLFLMRYLKKFLAKNGVKNAKYIPEVMMLVVGGIVFMYFTRWNVEHEVKVLGKINGGFPTPITPSFNLDAIQVFMSYLCGSFLFFFLKAVRNWQVIAY